MTTSDWTRRSVVKTLGAGTAATLLSSCISFTANSRYFRHGVASGDPLQHRVIIWTRISTTAEFADSVRWEVATDQEFSSVVAAGRATTGRASDYTVKIDVTGLEPDNFYYYRFRYAGGFSSVGRTKTLSAGRVESISLAVVSCSNYPAGYFNVYDAISRLDDIDAVLHLGDYIYEYDRNGYATEHAAKLGRVPDPPHELTRLDDYRLRYAQYRSDADLQAMHQQHPMIAVWDDHEFANNAWQHGAQNHNDGEGDWGERKYAARKAFREWMPIRDGDDDDVIYRSFEFGDLATLAMLDTRITGRDQVPELDANIASSESVTANQIQEFRNNVLNDPNRELLGTMQSRWLKNTLRSSSEEGKFWQIIGQQVVMGSAIAPDLGDIVTTESFADKSPGLQRILGGIRRLGELELPLNFDAWDGYAAARERLYKDFHECTNNTVVFSGDSHSGSASDLIDRAGRQVGVEFAATGVSSPGFGYYLPDTSSQQLHGRFQARNSTLRYINTLENGFCVCHLNRQRARNEWHVVDTVYSHHYAVSLDHAMVVAASDSAGTNSLRPATS